MVSYSIHRTRWTEELSNFQRSEPGSELNDYVSLLRGAKVRKVMSGYKIDDWVRIRISKHEPFRCCIFIQYSLLATLPLDILVMVRTVKSTKALTSLLLLATKRSSSFVIPGGSKFSTLLSTTKEFSNMASDGITTSVVNIDKPESVNVIVGMTHFIKTVDDIHEALVSTVPGIKFGLGFCEASMDRLVRWTGTDPELIDLAKTNASSIGCGHSFILFLGDPTYPIHVLNTVKIVPEVCRIFCATANPLQIVVAETDAGRGIMGVIDGQVPLGVETEKDISERRELLKKFGYKL